MKIRQFFTLMLAALILFTALSCGSSEFIPTAQAMYTLEDGTVLDPGSHGLIIKDIDTKLITSESQIRKIIKSWGEEADEDYDPYDDVYKDYSFWNVSITVKNNFPVDIYGFSMMLYALDAEYNYTEQWWENVGKTVGFFDDDYYEDELPEGFRPGEVIMKPGETYTHTFNYYVSEYAYEPEYGIYPQYIFVDWYEFWTKDECVMEQAPQISPYVELNGYKNAAKKHGISANSKNTSNTGNSYDLEIIGIEFVSADLDDISKEDLLLEMRITCKNNSDKDIENPNLDLLFYNKNGDMVYRDCEYPGKGVVPAGEEATLSAGYYYAEDPYYIPHTVKEVSGSKTFKTPVIQYRHADLTAETTAIAAGTYHTVYIKSDGTVGAVGRTGDDRCKVGDWMDIISVDASSHTVGLKSDGTVVATGPNKKKQCNITKWEDIIAVAAGSEHTVGLKSDGTVVAVGNSAKKRLNISGWKDIIAIDAGSATTYGLKADGSVVATGSNSSGQAKVTHWADISAISAGDRHVVGLKSDGTVVVIGSNSFGECDVSGWTDIVAVAAGNQFTIGLKSDGTVVATGNNKEGQCNVSGWSDIVAISAGMHHVIGIREDGSYITAGSNGYGQCDLS